MNYYEELGVPQDAPVADIRRAYKRLARLLHPDRRIEPELKPVAERQMQRLGEIAAVLSDPGKRSQYDESLRLPNRLPAIHGTRTNPLPRAPEWRDTNIDRVAIFVRRHWFWILNVGFVLALSTWAVMQGPSAVPDHGQRNTVAQRDGVANHPRNQKAKKNQRRLPAVASAVPPTRPAERAPENAQPPSIVPAEPLPVPEWGELLAVHVRVPQPLAAAPEKALPAAPPAPGAPSFAGRWLYAPQSGDEMESGMYSATYVELLLVEHAGELSGDYRARYHVSDRAVSPEISFKIRGAAGPGTCKVSWSSSDHARGEAEMVLRGANALYMNWWTTEFGWRATLASGTAVLVRLETP